MIRSEPAYGSRSVEFQGHSNLQRESVRDTLGPTFDETAIDDVRRPLFLDSANGQRRNGNVNYQLASRWLEEGR